MSCWLVSCSPDGRLARPADRGSADVSVEAPAGWLVLALYGRVPLKAPAFHVAGATDAAQRFRAKMTV